MLMAMHFGERAMAKTDVTKPAAPPDSPADSVEVAIERAMNNRPKAMLMRDKLVKMLDDEANAKMLVGALRNMLNQP